MNPTDDATRARTMEIVRAYQALIAAKKFDEWIELWAEEGVCEFPYAAEGAPRRLEGRVAILDYMTAYPGRIVIDGVAALRVHPMLDPASAAVEVTIAGRALQTGKPYDQSYVMVFETRDGKLAHYREYWNPLISMEAFAEPTQ